MDSEVEAGERMNAQEKVLGLWSEGFPPISDKSSGQRPKNVETMSNWKNDVNAIVRRVAFGLPGHTGRIYASLQKVSKKKAKDGKVDDNLTWQERQRKLLKHLDEAHKHAAEDVVMGSESLYVIA